MEALSFTLIFGDRETEPKDCTLFVPGKLAVIGKKPAYNPSKNLVIVGDIWLSNRGELLSIFPSHFSPTSDEEIIALLWEKQGDKCLEQLQGVFAFVVWEKEINRLTLVRDRTGGRTLYYTKKDSNYFIASRLKTLSNYHGRQLDLTVLVDYLSTAFVPSERTFWQNVSQMPPGTILKLPEKTFERYCTPWEEINIIENTLQWHSEKLRLLLEKIIEEYLPSKEPVGVYLSGGLDSSCITALAAKFHSYPVHTYSIHFGADCPNELEYSSLIAQHCKTKHHILEITPKQMWEELPATMANLDQPIGDPLTVPNYLLAKLAKQDVGVILNGEGGDPCFGGPKNQPMLLNQLYGETLDIVSAYLTSFQKCYSDLPRLLKPEIWHQVNNQKSIFAEDLLSGAPYINRLMMLNIKYKGAAHILTKVNNLTNGLGLNGRSPLFDARVVQMSLEIPPEYKLSGATEKAVLKQAVADLIPLEIIQRPKSGMMVPVQLWFRACWQRQARELLLSRRAFISNYLNREIIRDWLNYQGDTWRRYGVKLWLLVSLEIWLQTYKN